MYPPAVFHNIDFAPEQRFIIALWNYANMIHLFPIFKKASQELIIVKTECAICNRRYKTAGIQTGTDLDIVVVKR